MSLDSNPEKFKAGRGLFSEGAAVSRIFGVVADDDDIATCDAIFARIDRCRLGLPDLLGAVLREAAERLPIQAAVLSLPGIGTLRLGRLDQEVTCEWLAGTLPAAAGTSPGARSVDVDEAVRAAERLSTIVYPPPPSFPFGKGEQEVAGLPVVLPVTYARSRLGELCLTLAASRDKPAPHERLLGQLARHCGLLVQRYEVQRRSERHFARPQLLVGMSRQLRDLERFVEIVAWNRLPVVLQGEFGTAAGDLAAYIHLCGPDPAAPFVVVGCADPVGRPADWLDQARHGTLFLQDIDELDPGLQRLLLQGMPKPLDRQPPERPSGSTRIIASTKAELRAQVRNGQFSRRLLAELDYLSARIPPLRDRIHDIEPLVCRTLVQNGFRVEDKLAEATLAICKAYDWPENESELERVVLRLAVMTAGRPIQAGDIARYAPDILPEHPMPASEVPSDDEAIEGSSGLVEPWVRCAIAGTGAELAGLHPALRRALLRLGERYAEPHSLADLAEHAGASVSHLSFLFRTCLGLSFKVLLHHIRIHKACELLADRARPSVTEVALRTGFADLSHFERSFRRIMGQTPRGFRRSLDPHGGEIPLRPGLQAPSL